MSVFNEIRQSCRRVVKSADFVRMKFENIDRYIPIFRGLESANLTHTDEHHYLHHGEDSICFFLVLDSVNFGSGYFPYLKKIPGFSGYFSIAKALKDYFVENGTPSPGFLEDIDAATCARMFRQDPSNAEIGELLERFSLALSMLGELVLRKYQGRYMNIFSDHGGKAEVIIARLREMPFFNDVEQYDLTLVKFLKRAQILVQDIAIAEPDDRRIQFTDLNSLTAFADNVIPYVLRCDGIIDLDPDLERRIESEVEIEGGSIEEIELRASAIVAVSEISERLGRSGIHMPDRIIDYHLWNRGQQLKKHFSLKRHRTRTVFY